MYRVDVLGLALLDDTQTIGLLPLQYPLDALYTERAAEAVRESNVQDHGAFITPITKGATRGP